MTDLLKSRSFSQLAADLAKPGSQIALDLAQNPAACHLLHMAVGVSGEAGELLYANNAKLAKRYAAGSYSNEQAQERADKNEPVEDWVAREGRLAQYGGWGNGE